MMLVYLLVGVVIGVAIGYFLQRSRTARMTTEAAFLKQQSQHLQVQIDKLTEEQKSLQTENLSLTDDYNNIRTRHDILQNQNSQLVQQLSEERQNYGNRVEELKQDYEKRMADIRSQYETLMEQMRQQQHEQQEQQARLISEQINTVSEKILKERSEELSSANTKQLSTILTPLHESLKQMKEAVEKTERQQTTTMERLDASIKANIQQAHEVGERADKLANALTSENKIQGNFGELRLRTLLENMGLEEGVQFEEQTMMKNNGHAVTGENGQKLIPDVILHFPDKRDVIIDSKMSFKAFEDYYNAKTDAQRADALARHIESVRKHVKELSNKKYYSYTPDDHHKLDFVMMYVFSEGALQLALSNAPGLWKEAYDQNVVITGSQSLYMMLRVLEMSWRQERQAANQDLMMKAADELVNRVQMFYERLKDADDLLTKTRESFNDLKISASSSGHSIATAARKLIKYGAKENPKRRMRLPNNAEETESLPEEG
ncbi:MAG: DNA recombination protein RmuC [Prevotella sp.]|jgi:DNA recombination protein RmuC